jgi:UDP-2,4-diacetamido-2,4,6-trideoxy-beta-L-altropyranose hydrolase
VTRPAGSAVVMLRADATAGMGTGHLMRLRALAEGLREGGTEVHLLTATDQPGLLASFRQLGVVIHAVPSIHPDPRDVARLGAAAATIRPSWIVVDGYHFDAGYLEAAARAASVLVVDDLARLDRYPVAGILNQNAHALLLHYPATPETRLLLGTDYVLLRSEFRALPPPKRELADVRTMLVMAGGADPHRFTELVIEGLGRLGPVAIRVSIVVGPANTRGGEIRRAASALGPDVRVVESATAVRGLMEEADLAISTAGSTVWELAYMGVPALLADAGEAERLLVSGIERLGLFERIGSIGQIDASTVADAISQRMTDRAWRATMSERGRSIVDGRGVERVIGATIGGHA